MSGHRMDHVLERADTMPNWRNIVLHAGLAAVFMFVLQRFVVNAPLESSLLWALLFGGCAAGLAYAQSKR